MKKRRSKCTGKVGGGDLDAVGCEYYYTPPTKKEALALLLLSVVFL
jgi:hypothetical protein